MNMDIGEVLARSWDISWKNKPLWWIGIVQGVFLFFFLFPMILSPLSFPLLIEYERPDLLVVSFFVFIVFFTMFSIVVYVLSPIAQTSVALGVLKAHENEKPSLAELIRDSLPFFWRILGVMVLFSIALTIVNLAVQFFMLLITVATLGIGSICVTPLTFLLYPLIFLAVVWQEQAINGIVIDNSALVDAIKQGWTIVRKNLLAMALIAFVLYFTVGILTSVFVLPMMTPFFAMFFSLMLGEFNWTIILLSVLFGAAFFPLVALIGGWSLVFYKSIWILAYFRLTRSEGNPPELQPATA